MNGKKEQKGVINYPIEYKGKLPKYAQNADHRKALKVLCKGKYPRIFTDPINLLH